MSPLKSKPSFGRLRTKSLSEADVPSPTTPTSPLSPVSLKSSKSYGKLRKKKIPTEIVPPLPPLPSSPTTPTTPKTPFLKAKSSLGKLRGKAASQEDVPPLPPMPAEFATGMSPTYISQWVSNVNRLSKKERDRAVLTASAVDHNLSAGDNYDLYDTLKAFKEQDSLRSDITEMAATSARAADYYCPVVEDPRVDDTKVEDPRMEEIRARAKKSGEELPKGLNIVPWPAGDSPPNTPGSDTSRIPTAPKSPITPTPASITQAESSAAKNPRKNERRFSAPVRPSSPRSRALYEELLEMVDDLTVEIQKEELVPKLEAAVEAASRVLDMANEEFERFYSLSQPANTHERMEPFRNSGTYPQRESVDLPASGKAIIF
ncbi:unnamed protein product [Periconia digitata]|uniref:Uncharacterized protein n=1 Tax=Periconia digitata TaxID=1303443 RepID=A0A9W4UFR9_9PLEO|nr:unnamed protein product [Periconia digitata]